MTFTHADLLRLMAMEPFPELKRSAGDFGDIEFGGNEPALSGWMLLPDRELDGTRLYLDGKQVAAAPIEVNEGVADYFVQIPHARHSGFSYTLPKGYARADALTRVDLVGVRGEEAVCKIGAWYRPDIYTNVPLPPQELVWRVAHTQNMRGFRLGGFRAFGDFMSAALRHGALRADQQLLDWGCGCGRVTAHFGSLQDGPTVRGCDIDAEAIEWCNQTLQAGAFVATGLWPPTPYADAGFDLVLSYSVFTHLSREAQQAWLSEIQRILKPGGLFLASVHGESGARLYMPDRVTEMQKAGIFDHFPDETLDSFVPQGYSRAMFQTQAYTHEEWSEWFDILEFNEYGIGATQDLVVMQKSLDPAKWNRPKTVNRVALAGATQSAQSRPQSNMAAVARQSQEHKELIRLDLWAHSLEETVKNQQAQIQKYEEFLPLRMARWVKARLNGLEFHKESPFKTTAPSIPLQQLAPVEPVKTVTLDSKTAPSGVATALVPPMESRSITAKEQVANHWSHMAKDRPPFVSWMESPLIRTHINQTITGDPKRGWLEYSCRKYLIKEGRGVARGLSIGCGTGALERQARNLGACAEMDAFDIAPGAIEEAKQSAAAQNIEHINYQIVDLEETDLQHEYYDVVFASQAIHHFAKLEHLFANIKASLRPGGVFIMHEYVGPSQFQFDPSVVEMINTILALMPAALRERHSAPGTQKTDFQVPSIESMNANDPSEAIRSAEILSCLERDFDILEKKDFGGTLNHMLLHDIIHNFHDGSNERLGMLDLLLYHEDLLIREKVISSDFTFIVATPKPKA